MISWPKRNMPGFTAKFRLWLLAIALGISAAAPAHAEVQWQVGASLDIRGDDNVFRLRDNAVPASGGCRRDWIGQVAGNLGLQLGQARVGDLGRSDWYASLIGSVSRQSYDCNAQLSNTGFNGAASVDLPDIGPLRTRITGSTRRQLSSFNEFSAISRNAQTVTQAAASLRLNVTPEVALVANPTFIVSANDDPLLKPLDYRRYGADIGIGYFSPLGNSLILSVGKAKAKGFRARPVQIGNQTFDLRTDQVDTIIGLAMHYAVSPVTSIDAKVEHAKRDDRRVIVADFSGLIGDVSVTWSPREELTFTVDASRALSSQSYLFADGQRSDALGFRANDRLWDRGQFAFSARYSIQHFTFSPLATLQPGGDNRILELQAGVSTERFDRLKIGLELSHIVRLSGGIYAPFSDNSAQLQLTYAFGDINDR